MGHPPGRRPRRPRRHVPPVQRPERVGDLVGGLAQPGHEHVPGEPQRPPVLAFLSSGGGTVERRFGRPAGVPAGLGGGASTSASIASMASEAVTQPCSPVSAGSRRRPGSARRARRSRPQPVGHGRPQRGDRALGEAQQGGQEVDLGVALGGAAEGVEPAADLGVLQLAEVAVEVEEEVVEVVVAGRRAGRVQVVVEGGPLAQLPDLGPEGGELGRVEGRHLVVLVEEPLEPGQVVVDLGPGHRRDEVVDDDRVGPPLGLGALAGIVDHERVDERQVAEGGVGPAGRREADPLAGQPFQVAVLADVDDGVGPPRPFQPAVGGQVVVGRRQVGGVVDGDRVLAEAPGWLHHDQHVAEVEAGQADGAVVDVDRAGRFAPVLDHVVPQRFRELGEPGGVVGGVHGADGPFELGGRERLLLVGEPVDELGHEGVAVGGDVVDPVAGGAQGMEQIDHRGGGVEPDGVADPAPLRRVGRQHDGDPLPGVGFAAQRGQPDGGAGHPGDPVGHRPVGHDRHAEIVAVIDDLLERQRDRHDAAVELGQRHRPGGVER